MCIRDRYTIHLCHILPAAYPERSDPIVHGSCLLYTSRSAHFVDQCFDDGHTKTGAFVLCAGIRFFLSKRLEQFFFYEGLRYTNAGIPDHKFIDCGCIIKRNCAGISINASARLVVFDGVAEQVKHNLADLKWASHQMCIRDSGMDEQEALEGMVQFIEHL